jgi:hypothetical protein
MYTHRQLPSPPISADGHSFSYEMTFDWWGKKKITLPVQLGVVEDRATLEEALRSARDAMEHSEQVLHAALSLEAKLLPHNANPVNDPLLENGMKSLLRGTSDICIFLQSLRANRFSMRAIFNSIC